MTSREAITNRIKSLPPRAVAIVTGVTLLVFIFGRIAEAPAYEKFVGVAPPASPWPEFIAAIFVVVTIWAQRRESDRAYLSSRMFTVALGAIVTTICYLAAFQYLTVAPPPGREANRKQIGFYMYLLTPEAEQTRQKLLEGEPPKEIKTPNDLMNVFGVWGGAGRTDEIWPMWSILLAGLLVVSLFWVSCILWAYFLGALLAYLLGKDWEEDALKSLTTTAGHFQYESGFHVDKWLNIDNLFSDAHSTRGWSSAISRDVGKHRPDVVCGPSGNSALIAQQIASELRSKFVSVERTSKPNGAIEYRVPETLRPILDEKRALVVMDAVNLGTALRATLADVEACGGKVVAIATLINLGKSGGEIAKEKNVPYVALAQFDRTVWKATECPMCREGVPAIDAHSMASGKLRFAAIQVAFPETPEKPPEAPKA